MQFVQSDNGLINAAHIAEITECHHAKGSPRRWLFRDRDGRSIGTFTAHGEFDPVEATAPVIPAAAGATAIIVTTWGDGIKDRPNGVYADAVPIVAWRLCYDSALPVLIEKPCSNQVVLIVMPDGKLLWPDNQTFDDIESAKASLLRMAQADWDRAAARKAVSP